MKMIITPMRKLKFGEINRCGQAGGDRRRRRIFGPVSASTLALCLAGGTAAIAQDQVEHLDPDQLLREMSNYLGSIDSFTVDVEVDTDYIDGDGQKLTVAGAGHIAISRPSSAHAVRQDYLADGEFFFDGTDLVLYRHDLDAYAVAEGPTTIDGAIDYLRSVWGLDIAGADLLYQDVYDGLVTDLISSQYLGVTIVSGEEAHHLAFRAQEVDWQIWIAAGEMPLPLRYTITTKWMFGAPQFEIRLYNWNTAPDIDPALFEFQAPPGATMIDDPSADDAAGFFDDLR